MSVASFRRRVKSSNGGELKINIMNAKEMKNKNGELIKAELFVFNYFKGLSCLFQLLSVPNETDLNILFSAVIYSERIYNESIPKLLVTVRLGV